ncbi:MAG TPA: protein kinase [Pyrinomonadaceae bacterium]
MNAARLKQIEDIYQASAENAPADRAAFISARCGGDDELRLEVESLLYYDDISNSFIDSSPDAIAAEMFAGEVAPELIGTTVGHYRIERLLGEGGMGKVYLADDMLLSRKVALKILPPSLIEHHDRLKRFKQEAKAASALNHPNILTIHEFGTDEGSNYIVTEFVDGITLRQRMRGGLSVKETLEVAGQVASALAAAHAAGIVHRDIKPENIMIRGDGILKVLDFGLAKLSMPDPQDPQPGLEAATMFKTEPGLVMGTPHYMSPEQARGVKVDARTDIWSLGVIIYEMVTGKTPFAGPTNTDILAAILNQPVGMIDKFIDDAPAELQRIIDKTLAKDAEDRYRSIEELASDLKRFHHRLEFEAELKRTHRDAHTTDKQGEARETATRIMPVVDTPQVERPGFAEPVDPASSTFNGKHFVYGVVTVAVLISLAGIIGWVVWQSSGDDTAREQQSTQTSVPPAPPDPAALPSRALTYSLTVQSFTDGRYKEPFRLSGEMLFRNRDRIRLNIKSPQSGYLYILNQGPKNETAAAAYNILFPSPTANAGDAQLSAGQEIQIPQQSWFELDTKDGTELVWLVWSEKAVSELESAKRFANAHDRGRIKDAELNEKINSLLQKHQSNKANVERDDNKKESRVAGNSDIVTHALKLEHH